MSEEEKTELHDKIKEQENELSLLKQKLQIEIDSKEQVLSNLKSMMTDKDDKVINLNVEVQRLKDEVARLNDDLNERDAELEIANNELMSIKDEHYDVVNRNDDNIHLKNKELTDLHKELNTLKEEKITMLVELELANQKIIKQKEVRDNIKLCILILDCLSI